MNDCTLNFDGGVTGNCGPNHPDWLKTKGAWAFVALGNGGMVLREDSGLVAPASSNVAELHGCLHALRWALGTGYQSVLLRGDSTFVINWLRGINRTTPQPHIAPLQRQIAELVACDVLPASDGRRRIQLRDAFVPGRLRVTAQHVPRSKNRYADALCTKALKESPGG